MSFLRNDNLSFEAGGDCWADGFVLVLMREHPDLYGRLIQVYPKVQQMIHA